MGYFEIVTIVFAAVWAVIGAMLLHYAVFTIVGIFAKKKYPAAEEKLKYAVIIGARNEEAVIGGLLDSINAADYPKDKLQVFVVAHNCTDATAEVARGKGATVYEYDNPNERTVGYAYRYLVDRISDDYGVENYDGFFIINADNRVTENYFTKMNDAFVANGRKHVITSYRNSHNFPDNYMSFLYGIYFITACRFEARGRTVCGCSPRVSGTGYVFGPEFLKDGWKYVTLTEDWEFSADSIACGKKIYYCDDAEFFDEQPTTVGVMMRQRLRWARGHMVVFFTRFKELMKLVYSAQKGRAKQVFRVRFFHFHTAARRNKRGFVYYSDYTYFAQSAVRSRCGQGVGFLRHMCGDRVCSVIPYLRVYGGFTYNSRAEENTQSRVFYCAWRHSRMAVFPYAEHRFGRGGTVQEKDGMEGYSAQRQ